MPVALKDIPILSLRGMFIGVIIQAFLVLFMLNWSRAGSSETYDPPFTLVGRDCDHTALWLLPEAPKVSLCLPRSAS